MIIVALQMKNINHMYMTTWLVLHAAINIHAKQSFQPASGWQLHVASGTISATNLARFPQCEAVEAHSLLPLFRRKHPGKDKRGLIFSFFSERYIHRPSNIRCLPEKKLNAFVRS